MYEAKILADSIARGVRLTTMQVTFPRFILAEFNTHRMFSRNSASSRAIPVGKRIAQIRANPFVPEAFAANKRGMQAGETIGGWRARIARWVWLTACWMACATAWAFARLGVHKQWANRLVEPFAWHTVIVTATEWANFFALRISEHAQPEIHRTAELMKAAMDASTPQELEPGDWHLPLVFDGDLDLVEGIEDVRPEAAAATFDAILVKLSVPRCARVSYLTHDGKRDPKADFALYEKLRGNGHMSPFEHAAQVGEVWSGGVYVNHGAAPDAAASYFQTVDAPGPTGNNFIGNFRAPWVQHRKVLPGEAVFTGGA